MAESSLGSLWTMGMAQLGLGAPAEQAAAGTTPASPGGRDVEARAQQQPTAPPATGQQHPPQPQPPRPQPPAYNPAVAQQGAVAPGSCRYRALISVHDKEGAVHFAKELASSGAVELISTGGTHRLLEAAGLPVTMSAADTGFPEVLDGKWGTRCMSNELHAQVCTRSHRLHESEELKAAELAPIDLVVMNLFLFGSTVQPHTTAADAVENIDIGTPTMLRAAARNYLNVVVIVDPADYGWVAARVANTAAHGKGLAVGDERGCGLSLDERRRLAYKTFRHVAVYDLSVADYLGGGGVGVAAEPLTQPPELVIGWRKLCTVRAVGPAAERDATVYAPLLELDAGVEGSVDGGVGGGGGICAARKLGGPELSLPRLTDADVAWRAVVAFAGASDCVCMAVVHDGMVTGLCAAEEEGVTLLEVYQRAVAVYPPLGATLATNALLDGSTAATIVAAGSVQWAAVLAAEIDDDALDMFRSSEEQDAAQAAAQGRRRTTEEMTLLEVPLVLTAAQQEEDEDAEEEDEDGLDDEAAAAAAAAGKEPKRSRAGTVLDGLDLTPLTGGGLLVREPLPPREQASWTVVSDERPTAEELRDLVFGWRLLPHLPHGATVLCMERQMISPAYTWADQAQGVELALRVAGSAASGAILACDAPLTSTAAIELAAAGGVVAVVQPGGAARDSALCVSLPRFLFLPHPLFALIYLVRLRACVCICYVHLSPIRYAGLSWPMSMA